MNHGHDHVDLLGIVIGWQSESADLPIAVLREAHNFILTSPTGSLLPDDGYLGDISNDVSSLYVEIIDKN